MLKAVVETKRPLIIVAESVEKEALASLIASATRGTMEITAVEAPYFRKDKDNFLDDLCLVTGATKICSENELTMENVKLSHLGISEGAEILPMMTTVSDGKGNKENLKIKLNYLRNALKDAESVEESEDINQRIIRLSSGIVEIRVGGKTESEVIEKKYRIEDALNSVQASHRHGTVVGGGVVYLRLSKVLRDKLPDITAKESEAYCNGYKAFMNALNSPFDILAYNAHLEESSKEVKATILKNSEGNFGYNMLTHKFGDLREFGIIEPATIIDNVINNSFSIVSLLLNSKAIIL